MAHRYRSMLGLVLTLAIAGCATDVTDPGVDVSGPRHAKGAPQLSIIVDPPAATIVVGNTLQLSTNIVMEKKNRDDKIKENANLVWESANPAVATVSASGLVTALSGGEAIITASTRGSKAVSGSAIVTVLPPVPAWSTLVSEENAPGAPIFWCTNAPSDNALYAILGNGDFQPFTLWRFDLVNSSWTQIPTSNFPLGKYRQIVHDPVSHTIRTYWDGRGQVYSVSESGGAWTPVGSAGNSDEWYGAAAFWNGFSGRLSIFGGYGFFSWKNTLAAFNEESSTWTAEAQSPLKPGPRFAMTSAYDEPSNSFFINSGEGYPSGSQFDGTDVYNDVWRLDLSTNTWSQLVEDDGAANPTIGAGMDYVPALNSLFRFGGSRGAGNPAFLADLERVDLSAVTPRWSSVTTDGGAPSPRNSPAVFYDAPRKQLLVVGGYLLTGGTKLDVHSLLLR